jgi:hypothetical protein
MSVVDRNEGVEERKSNCESVEGENHGDDQPGDEQNDTK